MKKIIKNKNIFIFILIVLSIISTISFFNVVYIPNTFNLSAEITILVFWSVFIIAFSLVYGIFGLISSLSISLFFTIILVLWKFLEIEFSWSVFSALFLSIIISINNCLFLLEKTRINLQKNWNLKKSFEIAKRNTFITNADKSILFFFIASLIFLINKNEISTIGAILAISSILSFIVTTFINNNVINVFLKLSFKKNNKILFGLSNKFKLDKSLLLFKKTKYVKHIFLSLIIIGLILALIFSLTEEFLNVSLFQSKVIKNINIEDVVRGIITLFSSLIIIGLYVWIRYKWSLVVAIIVTLLQDVVLLIALSIITRLTISSLFIASILSLIIYSVAFNINSFSDIKDNIEIHVGKMNKEFFYKNIDNIFKKSTIRNILTIYFMLFAMLFIWAVSSQNIYTMGTLLGFVVVVISSKTIFYNIWIKMELLRLKKIQKRFDNHFWKTKGIEEQTIQGINNYNP